MIELPDHPWFPNRTMTADPRLLDELLAEETGSVERPLSSCSSWVLLSAVLAP